MTIMAIDQSLTGSGISVFIDEEWHYDLISSKKTKGTKSPSIDYTKRLSQIVNRYEEIIDKYNPEYIIIEGMSYGSQSSVIFELGGLSHLSRKLFLDKNIKFIIIPPKTLKKYFTQNGNADKNEMILQAEIRGAEIPFFEKINKKEVFNNNVVDSYAMACFVIDFLSGKCDDFSEKIEKSWED